MVVTRNPTPPKEPEIPSDALMLPDDISTYLPPTTVRPLITHTPRWTAQAMGFQGLWVYGGGKKISAHESQENFEKILFSPLQ